MFLRNWARLYTNLTAAEVALEPEVARLGERYRTQCPFFALSFIVDFALLDRRLIIEVDGDSHNSPGAKVKDQARALAFKRLGWNLVRVRNEEVLRDPAAALSRVLDPARAHSSEEELAAELRRLELLFGPSSSGSGRSKSSRAARGQAPLRTLTPAGRGRK